MKVETWWIYIFTAGPFSWFVSEPTAACFVFSPQIQQNER